MGIDKNTNYIHLFTSISNSMWIIVTLSLQHELLYRANFIQPNFLSCVYKTELTDFYHEFKWLFCSKCQKNCVRKSSETKSNVVKTKQLRSHNFVKDWPNILQIVRPWITWWECPDFLLAQRCSPVQHSASKFSIFYKACPVEHM